MDAAWLMVDGDDLLLFLASMFITLLQGMQLNGRNFEVSTYPDSDDTLLSAPYILECLSTSQ